LVEGIKDSFAGASPCHDSSSWRSGSMSKSGRWFGAQSSRERARSSSFIYWVPCGRSSRPPSPPGGCRRRGGDVAHLSGQGVVRATLAAGRRAGIGFRSSYDAW